MEQENKDAKPLVVSNKNVLYVYNGKIEESKFEFKNLQTGVIGILNKEQSQKLFKTPVKLNSVFLKHQNLISLFEAFNGEVIVEDLSTKEKQTYII